MQNSISKTLAPPRDITLLAQKATKLAHHLGFGQRSSQKALKKMAEKELRKVPVLLGDCDCWGSG